MNQGCNLRRNWGDFREVPLSELLHLYSPSRSLRSAPDARIFRVPRMCRRTRRERFFQYIGPDIWNSLRFSVRLATSLSPFKSKLKTHLCVLIHHFLSAVSIKPMTSMLVFLRCVHLCVSVYMNECVCCLLYTSPSPRDRTTSRMPSSA